VRAMSPPGVPARWAHCSRRSGIADDEGSAGRAELTGQPTQLHDPLVQVVRDVQTAGLQLSVLAERQVEKPCHLGLAEPHPVAVTREVLHEKREHGVRLPSPSDRDLRAARKRSRLLAWESPVSTICVARSVDPVCR